MSRTRRLTGLLAVAALAIAVLPFAAMGDTSIGTAGFSERAPAGTLTLITSSTNRGAELRVEYRDADDVYISHDDAPVSKNSCLISTATIDAFTLLDIEVPGAQLGLVSNGLGSSDEKGNCSTDNGRISLGENLKLRLAIPGLAVDWAELDVEGKFGAQLRATTNGVEQPTVDGTLTSSSDNGADAGAADNARITLGAPQGTGLGIPGDDFTELTLGVSDGGDLRGAVSLEGGGDYDDPATAQRTVFHLVSVTDYEFALGCNGDTITGGVLEGGVEAPVGAKTDDSFGLDGGTDGAQGYIVTRYDGDTSDDNATCDPIGADLSSSGPEALFLKTITDSNGDPETPAIRVTLQWRVPLTLSTTELEAELNRTIDLDPLGNSDPKPVEYCTTNKDEGGVLKRAISPNNIPWCLLSETIEVVDGYLLQTQVYDGFSDPQWR